MATRPDDDYLASLTSSYSPIYGQAISIRPMRPEDLDIETEFVDGWSAETRYNRLFSASRQTTPERLKKITRIDYTRDMALIATLMLEDREVQIGVARYVRRADNKTCEFALSVADAWQHRGIGRASWRGTRDVRHVHSVELARSAARARSRSSCRRPARL